MPRLPARFRPGYTPRPRYERFFAKVDKNGPVLVPALGCCWMWMGHLDRHGRGQLARGGKIAVPLMANRASWEIHYGPIKYGLYVLHRCDNPSCVNPRHLYLGTQKQNINDSITRGHFKGHINLALGREKRRESNGT